MPQKPKSERGLLFWKGRWWVRLYTQGRERRYACDSKSQARALYGRLRTELREGIYFPAKYRQKATLTLHAWLKRQLEHCQLRNIVNMRRYARRWSLYLKDVPLSQITLADVQRVRAKMRAKMKPRRKDMPAHVPSRRMWQDPTINRHVAFLRHMLNLAVREGHLTRNPVSGVTFFPEATRSRYLTEGELTALSHHLGP